MRTIDFISLASSALLALIGILKRKSIWNFLTHRAEMKAKSNDRLYDHLEKQNTNCKEEKQALQERLDDLTKRFIRLRGNQASSKKKP